jgi:hypothetical protein
MRPSHLLIASLAMTLPLSGGLSAEAFGEVKTSSPAQTQAPGATSLTIYSTARPGAIPAELYRPGPGGERPYGQAVPGYAVIKQERDIDIAAQRDTVRFADVASQIEPTTVTFDSLTDPEGTHVLDQNYQFDLVSTAKLMERYIDREITADQVQGDKTVSVTGTLLSTQGGLVLRTRDGGIQVLTQYSNVRFPELPGGLITRPTLVWDLATDKPGKHRTRVTYQTGGMTWWADYNVVFAEGKDANSGVLDVGAWVSIINQSGASYPEAKLKLIAGEVHRAPQPQAGYAMGGAVKTMKRMEMDAAGFEEKAFFEYHLYTLGRPSTLPQNSTKQIELFPTARGVPAEKVLIYYGLEGFQWFAPDPATDRNIGVQSNKKVDIYLRFKNEKAVGMGMPLPSGRIRVSKMDPADKSLEFIGEDTIDHTPKDEQVLIKLGSAFDVVGERRQVNFGIDVSRRVMDEDIEIKLRNHKNEPVKVLVKENLYRWTNWEITQKSHEFEKLDARTVQFPVTVPKDGETTITYKVHYSW